MNPCVWSVVPTLQKMSLVDIYSRTRLFTGNVRVRCLEQIIKCLIYTFIRRQAKQWHFRRKMTILSPHVCTVLPFSYSTVRSSRGKTIASCKMRLRIYGIIVNIANIAASRVEFGANLFWENEIKRVRHKVPFFDTIRAVGPGGDAIRIWESACTFSNLRMKTAAGPKKEGRSHYVTGRFFVSQIPARPLLLLYFAAVLPVMPCGYLCGSFSSFSFEHLTQF